MTDIVLSLGIDAGETATGADATIANLARIKAALLDVTSARASSQAAAVSEAATVTTASGAFEQEAQKRIRVNESIKDLVIVRAQEQAAIDAAIARTGALNGVGDAAVGVNQRFAASVAQLNAELSGGAQAATGHAEATTRMGTAATSAAAGQQGLSIATASVTREFVVLGHEVVSGNFSRIPGSLLVLTSRMGGLTSSVLTTAGALGAPLAALGALAVATDQYAGAVTALSVTNQGYGNVVQATGAQLDALAETSAATANISVSAAREQETAYLQTGKISADVMGTLIGLSHDYAAATGTDVATAGQNLAKLFADPARGAQELSDKFSLLSDTEKQTIEQLAAGGDRWAAQTMLADALKDRVGGLNDQFHTFGKTLQDIGTFASNAWNALGKFSNDNFGPATLDDLQAKLSSMVSNGYGVMNVNGQMVSEQQLRQMISDMVAQQVENQARGIASLDNQETTAAGTVARSIDPTFNGLSQNKAQISTLARGELAGSIAGVDPNAQMERLLNQRTDLQSASSAGISVDELKKEQEAQVQATAATMSDITAKNQYLAVEKARISLLGTATTTQERNTAIQTAGTTATASMTSAQTMAAAANAAQARSLATIADAYSESTAAGLAATAQVRALEEARTGAIAADQVAARTAQLLNEAYDQAKTGVEQYVIGLDRQTAAKKALADASANGVGASRDEEANQQAILATQGEIDALDAKRRDGLIDEAGYASAMNDILTEQGKIRTDVIGQQIATDLTGLNKQNDTLAAQLDVLNHQSAVTKALTPEMAGQLAYQKAINDAKTAGLHLDDQDVAAAAQRHAELERDAAQRQADLEAQRQQQEEVQREMKSSAEDLPEKCGEILAMLIEEIFT